MIFDSLIRFFENRLIVSIYKRDNVACKNNVHNYSCTNFYKNKHNVNTRKRVFKCMSECNKLLVWAERERKSSGNPCKYFESNSVNLLVRFAFTALM